MGGQEGQVETAWKRDWYVYRFAFFPPLSWGGLGRDKKIDLGTALEVFEFVSTRRPFKQFVFAIVPCNAVFLFLRNVSFRLGQMDVPFEQRILR